MKFPWVSREQHEEAKKLMQTRVDELTRDRDRVLDILLSGAVPDRRPEIRAVETQERQPEPEPEQGAPQSYTTGFDSVLSRFDQTFRNGKIPDTFKARAN